jgi:hypothetical protein
MTIDELIERLGEYRNDLGGDADVRLMTQSNYPFEYDIAGLASGAEIRAEEDDDGDVEVTDSDVLFIVEGQQLGYGSTRAWQAAK